MKCPKCQFDNIAEAIFCQECGRRLEIVCPKCGYRQQYSEQCTKCGIIINKFKKHEHIEEKTYKVDPSFLIIVISFSVGFFFIAGIFYSARNYVPAGVDSAVVFSILCVVFGIAFIFFYLYIKSYFVSVNEKEINIANKKKIPWEDIFNIEWNVLGDPSRSPIKNEWIDIYYSDEVKGKIVKIRIDHVEDIEFLFERIKKRVSCDIDGLTEQRFSITLTKMIILVILLVGFIYMGLCFNLGEQLTSTNTQSVQDTGADANIKTTDNGDTQLMRESYNGHADAVKLLLDRGAEVNVKRNNDGLTALWLASQEGHAEVVRLLLERGAEVNVKKTNDGFTPLMTASYRGHADVVKLLIDRGAEVDAEYKDGTTALWMASYIGNAEIVKLLLDKGAYVDAKENKMGGTALIVASNNGHTDVVRLLLDNGADVNVKPIIDNVEWTALKVAKEHGHTDIVQLLENAGAKE